MNSDKTVSSETELDRLGFQKSRSNVVPSRVSGIQ